MILKKMLGVVSFVLVFASPAFAQGLWHPGASGTHMMDNVYNVDWTHRQVLWTTHAGFEMSVDGAATYDNWRTVDSAPQIRIDFDDTSVNLEDRDFVITGRTTLQPGYGDRFHAGLCIVFSANDLLVWGPHGATDLRLRRPDGVDQTQPYANNAAFMKIKRQGDEYSAWYSADGKNWVLSATTTISATPIAAGTILKTWTVPHAETVKFDFLEITNVQNEPDPYYPNTRYGDTDAAAPIFKFELSGIEILLRVFVNDDGNAHDPEDTTLYVIHATTEDLNDGDECYDAILSYQRLVWLLENQSHPNMVLIAPRFMRDPCAAHPYGYPLGWGYQDLEGEEDWILLDIHEDYKRTRFAAKTPGADERFFLTGHSGGGQFVTRFIMGHSDKVIRAVASSPWGTAYPTGEYEWSFGTYLPSDFKSGNPRFTVDLAGARSVPLAVVVGEHDSELDRGWSDDVGVLSRRRYDNAMKWVRQMDSETIDLYIVPEQGHWFSPPKRDVTMAHLFGDASTFSDWLYSSPEPDFQDVEQGDLLPLQIPEGQLFYFQFDRFPRDVRRIAFADRRYTIFGSGSCLEENLEADPTTFSWISCTLDHTAGELFLTISETSRNRTYGGIWANLLYGKLRLYSTDMEETYMLEESSAATEAFVESEVVGRRFHVYECSGRGPHGPECGPFPVEAIKLNADHTVVNPDTGLPPAYEGIRSWSWSPATNLLQFRDRYGIWADLQIGNWRWGEDAMGQPFVAGLHTREQTGPPRREIQTNAIYNPRYFEDWDVDRLDYDHDKTTDILDNCPVTENAYQIDSDGDGLGDACDPAAPSSTSASDGTAVQQVLVSWTLDPVATHYQVYRNSTNNSLTSVALTGWLTTKSFTDEFVIPGHDYFYWTRATVYPEGNSHSGLGPGDGGWAALAAPGSVFATDGTVFDQVNLEWAPVSGAASYRVFASATDDLQKATDISGWQSDNEFVDANLQPNTVRYYWVQASPFTNGGRNSALSESDSGWYRTSAIFDCGFESGNLADWSSSQP